MWPYAPSSQEEKDKLAQETEDFLIESVLNYEKYRRDTDYRYKLKGFLNPDNCAYNLPKSHAEYKDISDLINNKPYEAFYPQSSVEVPDYFAETGLDPYFQIRPIDDYAHGVATIAQMINMTANGIRWCLIHDKDLPEILRHAENYREEFNYVKRTAWIDQYARFLDIFIREMRDGELRMRIRQSRRNGVADKALPVSAASIFAKVLGFRGNK